MKPLCITTVFNSRYSGFEALFKHFVTTQYPEYECKVFNSDNFDIPKTPYLAPCLRFLLPEEHFENNRWVYYTDIDMIILREEPTLQAFHIQEMNKTGLCFSNSPRGAKEPMGLQRLTGLHFINENWFQVTQDIRDEYFEKMAKADLGYKREDDELMLFDIVKRSKLIIPPKTKLVPRHHGIHLGSYRIYDNYRTRKKRAKLKRRISDKKLSQYVTGIKTPAGAEAVKLALENDFSAPYILRLHQDIKARLGVEL